jgi:hypothetical protein
MIGAAGAGLTAPAAPGRFPDPIDTRTARPYLFAHPAPKETHP